MHSYLLVKIFLVIPYIDPRVYLNQIFLIIGRISVKSSCIITAPVVPTACLRVRYAGYVFTRLAHQPPAYASGALLKH